MNRQLLTTEQAQEKVHQMFPELKQEHEENRKRMVEKYGEEEVRRLENIGGLVSEALDLALKDLLG